MPRVRLSEEDRRAMIIRAINSVAREPSGPMGVTHGVVAQRCTVQTSKATVRHYFATKADLVAAIDK